MNITTFDRKIGGIINYLELTDFWISLDENERDALTRYYRGALGGDPNGSPIKGTISFSTETQLGYLDDALMWAVYEKNYSFADKIIMRAEQSIGKGQYTLPNLHYYLQNAAECYYKQRDNREDAIDKTVMFCKRDIQAFPYYSKELIALQGSLPRIQTFQRLAIIYEKTCQYQRSIEICDLAMKYGLSDGTKGDYEGRKKRLLKKLNG